MAKNPYKASPYDFWRVNGSRQFGIVPANTLAVAQHDADICLQRGMAGWGEIHIVKEHGHWLAKHGMTTAQMVWTKCQQQGSIYSTEEDEKFKISMVLAPDALLVLRYIPSEKFFTVVTVYFHEGKLDGSQVGHYAGSPWTGGAPILQRDEPASLPAIHVKKKRKIVEQ